jgi:hypothetical protein
MHIRENTEMVQKASQCPSCGNMDFDPAKQCICGYHSDEAFLAKSPSEKLKHAVSKETRSALQKETVKNNNTTSDEDLVVKELDSWRFTHTEGDAFLRLSTPALQAFSIQISIEDLEELLEFMYIKSGKKKTLRKLLLTTEELPDIIDTIYKLIEEKRSRVPIQFDSNELGNILNLINFKLKV